MVDAVARWAARAVGARIDQLFVELPQGYDPTHQKKNKRGTDPNDLIMLAAVVGGITASAEFYALPHRLALPHEWKGTIPKEIMHARAVGTAAPGEVNPLGGVLTPAELAAIPNIAKSKLHNVLDAVCMGLVMAGRLRTGGLGAAPARA